MRQRREISLESHGRRPRGWSRRHERRARAHRARIRSEGVRAQRRSRRQGAEHAGPGDFGRGGTGTVYEAFDTKTHAVVALKTVEAAVAENLYRLKHEFRVLAHVQHQNLVHFGELACEQGNWFFTMELVSGTSFIDYVRPRPPRAPDAPVEQSDDAVTRTVDDHGAYPSRSSLTTWEPAATLSSCNGVVPVRFPST